ncbi:unnamed protein product [Gadus morhua 'NCC']
MKSLHVGILLLIVYSTAALNQHQSERYQKFKIQHHNPVMSATATDCNSVINGRNISETNTGLCKWTNTFITATLDQINAVCPRNGRGLITSNNPFTFVECKLNSGDNRPKPPNCMYKVLQPPRLAKRIVIRCEAGFPMHFERCV